jgi:hypothetical protein
MAVTGPAGSVTFTEMGGTADFSLWLWSRSELIGERTGIRLDVVELLREHGRRA